MELAVKIWHVMELVVKIWHRWDVSVIELAVKFWLTVRPLGCLCDGARGEDLADVGTTGMSL